MAIANVPLHPSTSLAPRASCCLIRAHDAGRLASATAAVVTPGRLLDVGCGAGDVAIHLHQFDDLSLDIPYGPGPTFVRAGAALGFEVSIPHRGWGALGPASAVCRTLPALGRLFPDSPVLLGEAVEPLAHVPSGTSAPLAVRHSIVRLHRPATMQGVLQ